MQEPWYSPMDAKSHPCRWRWYKTQCKAKFRFQSGQGRCSSHGRCSAKCSGSVGREEITAAVILLWNSAQKLMGRQHLPKSALKTSQDGHRKTTSLDTGINFYCCCFTGHLPGKRSQDSDSRFGSYLIPFHANISYKLLKPLEVLALKCLSCSIQSLKGGEKAAKIIPPSVSTNHFPSKVLVWYVL